MKTKLFALAVSVIMIAFAVNSTVIAQNKETKKLVKQTEQKVDTKINNAKTSVDTKVNTNTEQIKEYKRHQKIGEQVNNNEKNIKTTKMNVKKIKHHKMPVKKVETKKTETEVK